MNKSILIVLSFIVFFTSCTEEFTGYEINGQIKGLENQELILQFLKQNEVIEVDTVMTDTEGKFIMKGHVVEKGFYRISSGEKGWIFLLEDGVNPSINIDANNTDLSNIEITNYAAGEQLQKSITFLNEKNKPIYEMQYKLQAMFQDTMVSMQEKMAAQQEFMQLKTQNGEEVKSKIDELISEFPFSSVYLLPLVDDIEFVKGLMPKFDSLIPNSIYVKNIKDALLQIEQQQEQQNQLEAQKQTQIQQDANTENKQVAKEIIMNNPEGKAMKLSSLKGKVVLVDFWASWCRPCRAANPGVVKIYHKYKTKGFDVFSVSLDKDADRWKQAIKQDGLIWNSHVSDLKYWQNAAAKSWGVNSIPATFLLDKQGNIVARNLKGAALEAKIKELL